MLLLNLMSNCVIPNLKDDPFSFCGVFRQAHELPLTVLYMHVFFHNRKNKADRRLFYRAYFIRSAVSSASLKLGRCQIKDVLFILKHRLIRTITCPVESPIKMLITIPVLQQLKIHYVPLVLFSLCHSASLQVLLPT